ncbi:PIN domain-containing protein [uncultured Sphingomonas sp.]|uniref:type II toxin-antitoxin system VapC family toxin n=1 Tax=uncultured Sphingomonas sp. TaxID=158754 RepID=UPI0025DCF6DF|nr:PIN domain-containing protein [uncultured Sphingomonas sp.]
MLDTHFLVWLAGGGATLLSRREQAAIEDAEAIAVSAVSLWELRIKWDRRTATGARKGPMDPQLILAWLNNNDLSIIDLTAELAVATLDPPLAHSDPFDELLLTQAQQAGYHLLTRDAKLASHPFAVVAE